MKARILTTILFIPLFSIIVKAQTFTVGPDSTLTWGNELSNSDIYDPSVRVENITTKEISLKWLKIYNVIESGWETTVCDKANCTYDSGSFNLDAATSGILNVHFNTGNIPGNGTVQVYIWDKNDLNSKDTVTYFGKIAAVGVDEIVQVQEVTIFPNPARNTIRFSDNLNAEIESMVIFDLLGNKILSHQISENKKEYSIDDLSEGFYFVRFIAKDSKVLFTKSLSVVN